MDWLRTIVGSMGSETVFFVVLIFVFFIFLNLSFNRRAVTQGPAILTTFGIFGTFVGIAVGLSEFDTENVRAGVPALLSGLKTAFWASVFGVGGALLLKLRVFLVGTAEEDDEKRAADATVEDVVKAIHGLQHSLAGRHEESLLTQMKMMRLATEANLAALRTALGEETEASPSSADVRDDGFAAMKMVFPEPDVRFGKRPDIFAPAFANGNEAPTSQ